MQCEGLAITKYRQALQSGALLLGNRPSNLNDIKHNALLFVSMCQCNMRVFGLNSTDKHWKMVHCC